MADTLSTLENIRIKVRRLTKSPSTAQISNDTIDNYVNTFILYDFPEHVRLFSLRSTFTFYTTPYQDVYETTTTDDTSLLYDFKDKYTGIYSPVYINGYLCSFTQSQTEFYANYSPVQHEETIGTGDGATANYASTLTSYPVLRSRLTFSTRDGDGDPLIAYDDGSGSITGDVDAGGTNEIDYETGEYDFTFDENAGDGESVYANYVPYTAARPTTLFYFDNKITLRPVPDKSYRVDITVDKRPTALIEDDDNPELTQWWQFFAIGASRKILQDRMDMESVALLEPEFREQELLILRRTIAQQSTQQVATIYNTYSNFDPADPFKDGRTR